MSDSYIEVYLFINDPEKLLDRTVGFVTNDNIRHAAISFPQVTGNKSLYESNGWKGQALVYRKLEECKGKILVARIKNFDASKCFEKANKLIGTKYDYLGFFGFPINRQNKNKLYCFEYVISVLAEIPEIKKVVPLVKDGSISGKDIYKILRHGYIENNIEFEELDLNVKK